MTKTILGVFTNRTDAEDTIDKLRSEGFNAKDISLVMQDKAQKEEIANDTGTDVADGALSGVATGAVVGGIAGLLAGTAMPVLGGLLIAGPLGAALGLTGVIATTVSGAATGAVVGGLIGALMSVGVNKEDATHYQERINQGAILIAVPAANSEEESIATDIFDEFDASDVKTVTQASNDFAESNNERGYRNADNRESARSHEHPHFHSGLKGGRSKKRVGTSRRG